MKSTDLNRGEIVLYRTDDGKTALDVRLEAETVWLTQAQLVQLFQRNQSVISRHINNVFKEKELDPKSNMQKMHSANSDKPVLYYSLDAIISVGYRQDYLKVTRAFRITIMERAARDARFRQHRLIEAIDQLLTGDLAAGKAMLRDDVNATISFDRLARMLKKSGKSLHRMLGPQGNPTAENLFGIIKALQAHERVQRQVKSQRSAA